MCDTERMDRTLCPICLQEVSITPGGFVETHNDSIRKDECPYSRKEAPAWTERNTRAAVDSRSNGICEWCQRRRATDKHHRISRGVGGKWNPANIIDLCRIDHQRVTHNPDWAWNLGLIVKVHEDPETEPVVREDTTIFQPTSMVVMEKGRKA